MSTTNPYPELPVGAVHADTWQSYRPQPYRVVQ